MAPPLSPLLHTVCRLWVQSHNDYLFSLLTSGLHFFDIQGSPHPSTGDSAMCPDDRYSSSNPSCCALFPILEDIQENLFDGGTCGSAVLTVLDFHSPCMINPPPLSRFANLSDSHSTTRLVTRPFTGKSSSLCITPFFLIKTNSARGGGADGSIITFSSTELAYRANQGLKDIVSLQQRFVKKYESYMSAGDLCVYIAMHLLIF